MEDMHGEKLKRRHELLNLKTEQKQKEDFDRSQFNNRRMTTAIDIYNNKTNVINRNLSKGNLVKEQSRQLKEVIHSNTYSTLIEKQAQYQRGRSVQRNTKKKLMDNWNQSYESTQ